MPNKKTESQKKKTTKTNKKTSSVSKISKKETPKKEAKKAPMLIQEENNYGRTILAAVIICVIFLTGYIFLRNTEEGKGLFNNEKITEDEKKFKKEYESINGAARNNGQTNKKIEITEDNNITYISLSEALKIIEDGSGVIYFGYAADPYCRNAVPVLLDAAKETKLDKIYYVNIRPEDKLENDIRDTYELNDKNKAKQVREGAAGYKDLLTLLANHLNDYILTSDKGKKVNTGEKRLVAPTVVAIKKGEVVGFHEGTVSSNKEDSNGNLADLSESEEKSLKETYTKIIKNYLG